MEAHKFYGLGVMAKKKKKRDDDKRPFWTLDAETDPFKQWRTPDQQRIPTPFIWGLYTGAGMHYFETVDKVVEAIRGENVIVFAHNGGKFDFHLEDKTARILDHINLREDMKLINGRLVSAKIGQCEIRDSWNLLPAPLREFGSKLDIDYRKLEAPVRAKHMPEIRKYLAQDCVGLWNGIAGFEAQYGRHLTQAGAAMAQWQKISGLKQPRTDAHFFAKFSRYYHGGRVQAFEKGYINETREIIDIRSAYPRAMLDEHPYEPGYIELAYPRSVIGSDMVKVRCRSAGALPYKGPHGEITFPIGGELLTFYCTGWEVNAGIETGTISEVEIINAIRFTDRKDFSPYINHFYKARQQYRAEGNDAQAFFAKILMNSLYGKFGANPENYGNYMAVPWDEKLEYAKGGELYDGQKDFRFNGGFGKHAVVRADLDDYQQHFINVATAASITGWVRAYLWRTMAACGKVSYCDTDCIFTDKLPEGLEIGEELGQWNHEGTATELWIAGKKNYYVKGKFEKGKIEKMACKGVKPDKRKIKLAALGRTVTVKSAPPTFSLKGKRPVYFQQRRIRMTG